MAEREIIMSVDYDVEADILYLLLDEFSGNVIADDHPTEDMIDLLYSKETGKIVGMVVTDWQLFRVKLLATEISTAFTKVSKQKVTIPDNSYGELCPALAPS